MSTAPIYDAVALVRGAVEASLGPLVFAQQGSSGSTRLYYQRRDPAAVFPCAIHQSQDLGGLVTKRIGDLGWSGLWQLSVYAMDAATALAWLGVLAVGMDALTATGYAITTEAERPITFPLEDTVHRAGHLWRITLNRSP